MKKISGFLLLTAIIAYSGCRPREFNPQNASVSAATTFVGFSVKTQTVFKKRNVQSSALASAEMCPLAVGVKLETKAAPTLEGNHYKVDVTSDDFSCAFKTGYVFSEHVTVSSGVSDSSFCQKSWEESPGTTDYTTFDEYSQTYYSEADRSQSKTLLGSGVQRNRKLCEKAQALKHCFVRTVVEADNASAKKFRAWASAHGINPMLALMAKTEQETKMGTIADNCSGGNCNGIGIGQIITAFDENGAVLTNWDKRWKGITFNILTNLTYSVRVLAAKTSISNSLYDLAYYYNGSSGAANYASRVSGFYQDLKGCGL